MNRFDLAALGTGVNAAATVSVDIKQRTFMIIWYGRWVDTKEMLVSGSNARRKKKTAWRLKRLEDGCSVLLAVGSAVFFQGSWWRL